ncbi:hypothetical protein B7463_g3191, partial [Scytalidium lignicola]
MALYLNYTPPIRNEYADLVAGQSIACVDSFILESGVELRNVNIAYKIWGSLNTKGDNCLVLCHALTGSSDVEDWWGPLIGSGKPFDTSRYFIFCANLLGSPYGSSSPLSVNPDAGRIYGPDFPQTTIRDDIRLHKQILDALNVTSVTAVIGGSMGGMTTLEWPLCTPKGYVKTIIPIATSADHSAWGIAWGEAQRQCIYADPQFEDGYYLPTPATQPAVGLAAARMAALLTYRSCSSFQTRFGRGLDSSRDRRKGGKPVLPISEVTPVRTGELLDTPPGSCTPEPDDCSIVPDLPIVLTPKHFQRKMNSTTNPLFSAQSYLRYQGQKFIRRFDANCYIHLTYKMDLHDVTRDRCADLQSSTRLEQHVQLSKVLSAVPPGALVIGVESDELFRLESQELLAKALPEATLSILKSPEGHDGFLLEFEKLGELIQEHLMKQYP